MALSSFNASLCSLQRARLAKSSSCPTRKNEGATRVEMAAMFSTMISGSYEVEFSRYQGLSTVSDADMIKLSDRDVGMPSACICSCARNSRTLERNTARPSAPLQYGVRPDPFSCISQRRPLNTPSTIEIARPSP